VIDEYLDEIEKLIKDDHLIIFSDVQKVFTSQNTAYTKVKAKFIDNSLYLLMDYYLNKLTTFGRLS